MHKFSVLSFFILILSLAAPAEAAPLSLAQIQQQEAFLVQWVRTCTNPCSLPETLKVDGTGSLFMIAGWALAFRGVELRLDSVDQCNSGCTLLVDQMKKWGGTVCVGSGVWWGMHRARRWDVIGKEILLETPTYDSPLIAQWINRHNGIPQNGAWLVIAPSDGVVQAAYGTC